MHKSCALVKTPGAPANLRVLCVVAIQGKRAVQSPPPRIGAEVKVPLRVAEAVLTLALNLGKVLHPGKADVIRQTSPPFHLVRSRGLSHKRLGLLALLHQGRQRSHEFSPSRVQHWRRQLRARQLLLGGGEHLVGLLPNKTRK